MSIVMTSLMSGVRSLTQMKYEIDCFPNGRQSLKT